MRVVITGASGNVGTALLEQLAMADAASVPSLPLHPRSVRDELVSLARWGPVTERLRPRPPSGRVRAAPHAGTGRDGIGSGQIASDMSRAHRTRVTLRSTGSAGELLPDTIRYSPRTQ